uniref:Nitrilase/cyanide hydratase and apolipoprotein N-acyltransferase n=1 Tax=Caulobacter sp. (strain K31) TaxID=366602 RepID=B0T9J3_CAUSK
MIYRAAVIQAAAIPFAPLGSAEKAAALITEAGAAGAKLAVFPEAFIGGYPKGAGFGTTVGRRDAPGREAFERYHRGAVALDGPEVAVIAAAAAQADVFVVIGVIERDGGTLYCTALFIDPEEGLVSWRRKLMPTGAERLIWGFGDGSTLSVVSSALGRVGAAICWENYMPLMRTSLFAQGVELYCAPTADDRETWAPTMRHVALEGRCFVLSACQFITRSAYPSDYDCVLGDTPETVLLRGGSLIVDPMGQVLAGPVFDVETILYADIDLQSLARAKFDFDVTGHYARPDVFRLTVDTTARSPVIFAKLEA